MADDPNIPTCFGWDASDYDWARGPMDLGAAARDGIVFFTHKATEGSSKRHSRYGEALHRARDAGIPVLGAYHVVRTAPSIASQVAYMLSYLDSATPWWRSHPHFFIQVDLELWEYDKVPASVGEAFADAVQQASGKVAIIYASRGQYGNQLAGTSHDLWNANYGTNIEDRYASVYAARGGDSGAGWVAYSGRMPVLWQFGSRTRIGTQTICDANAFRGTLNQLKALVSASTAHSEGDLTMFMAQVSGNPAIVVSTGIKYRHIDYPTFVRYRDQLHLPHIVVGTAAELAGLCGDPEFPGLDPVTLTAEQLAAIEAAAAKGAAAGAPTAQENAAAVVAEIAS